MDDTNAPQAPTPPAPDPRPTGRGFSPFMASLFTLLGTALGIIGSIATTAIGAHYTAKEHADDRAEMRAKERREALTKTYSAAISALRTYEDEALRLQDSKDPADHDLKAAPSVLALTPKDVGALLDLMGSKEAISDYYVALWDFSMIRAQKEGPDRTKAFGRFAEARQRFIEAARADMESHRF
jgi:hypothetical protein